MFSDTLAITIDGVAKTLVRINQDGYSSEYLLKETDGEFRLRIRNSSYADKARSGQKVDRHNVEFVHTIYPVSVPGSPRLRKTYIILENDNGDPLASALKFSKGFNAFLTDANITKLLNWES